MTKLKPCPFCGHTPETMEYKGKYTVMCRYLNGGCGGGSGMFDRKDEAVEAWNKRTAIETNIFDEEEIHKNCTVQIWRNSVTGAMSVGWWEEKS